MIEVRCVINVLKIGVRTLYPECPSFSSGDLFTFDFREQAGAPVVGFRENRLLRAPVAGRALGGVLVHSRLSGKRDFAYLSAFEGPVERLTAYIIE